MARVFESEDDRAAPVVPEQREKAAEGSTKIISTKMPITREEWVGIQDIFAPKLGPEICQKFLATIVQGWEAFQPTTRSISPG